jgi:Photosynthetic reaction centre cytochrome C subunit
MRARPLAVLVSLLVVAPLARPAAAQAPGKFPPDSLVNTKVFPHNTPVTEVLGAMRNFTTALGVRCGFCHVGKEGAPISSYDFASDEKRTKRTARQMMLMLAEVNRRLDTLPERKNPGLMATCNTCHRGVNRPVPLAMYVSDVALSAGTDSAIKTYHALRDRYYGRDAYDFGEPSLNEAAFRLARAGKFDEALALLKLNEEQFPKTSSTYVFRGNVLLMRADTNAAADAFREAIRRDTTNFEARQRLRAIGRQ